MRIAVKTIESVTRHALVFTLIFTWVFSSWPQMFNHFPPKTEEAVAQAQGTGWYDAAWSYRKKLTVNQSKVAGTATSFPVLVSATSTDWKYTTHGGYVGTATASDILFTSADGITKLDHEIESYASSTGKLAAWVRMPYLSSATTNAIFIYYGNAANGQQDQQNKTGVWDSSYKGVWHLGETVTDEATSGTHYDSTSNGNNGTQNGNASTDGKIGGGQNFTVDDSDYIAKDNPTIGSSIEDFTVSLWFKNTGAAEREFINFGGLRELQISNHGTNNTVDTDTNGVLKQNNIPGFDLSSWTYIALIRSGTDLTLYGDAVAKSTVTDSSGAVDLSSCMLIGGKFNTDCTGVAGNQGSNQDEVRISTIARSATWIQTEYNNQSSPETFFITGNQESQWCSYNNQSWQYRKKITVNSSKLVGAQTDFPVLVNRTDMDFRTTANGGHVGSATGYDFVFTSQDCSVKYDHEIEKFASSTGELVAWVRYPFLSTTSTNSLYVYYGNAAAEDQQNVHSVWDSSYKGVWHMAATSTQLGTRIFDSTFNSNTGTKVTATEPVATSTGQINGAQDFDGSNDHVRGGDDIPSLELTSSLSLSGWIKPASFPGSDDNGIVGTDDRNGVACAYMLSVTRDNGPQQLHFQASSDGNCTVGSTKGLRYSNTTIAANQWYYAVGVYNASLQTLDIYLNGVLDNGTLIGTVPSSIFNSTLSGFILGQKSDTHFYPFDGILDEIRISNTVRSASWIQTEYNNQSSPATFLLFDTEDPLRGTYIDQYDILSDSRPGQTSNHTLQFIVNNDITASTSLVFSWPDAFTMPAPSNWYSGNWLYRKKITLDSSKIAGNADLTDFPVLVSSTQVLWKSMANGGNVSSATGWDFVITASDGVTKLDHEIEKFASTTGELVAWFRAPTLDRNAANEFYVYYGGPSTTDQQNVHGVWDSNFKGVWHMTTTSANTNISYDSTANSNTGTKFATNQPFSSSTGTINGAQDFDGNNDYIGAAISNSLTIGNHGTVSLWYKPAVLVAGTHVLISNGNNGGYQNGYLINQFGSSLYVYWKQAGSQIQFTNYFVVDNWYYITLVNDNGALKVFSNGQQIGTGTSGGTITASLPTYIGGENATNWNTTGVIDESRVSNTARSAAWIQTEYNNQLSPSTFHTIGNEEDNGVFDCGDVDVATGTEFSLGGINDCWATATHWGAVFTSSSRKLTISAPTNEYTHIATGTQITVQIGTNATAQFQGNSRITNPASTGTYTLTLSGSAGSVGNFLVSINEGQTVSAVIAENLSLTVSSVYAVNCTADDGASVTAKVSASTTVAFGDITANTFYIACQDLILSTNAGGGYSLTTQENHPLMTGSGAAIADTTCNGGTCTEATSAAWTTATVNGFGHTCYNQSGADCNPVYANGDNFRQFANTSNGETAQPIMASTTPAIATGRVKFRLNRGTTQASGTYSNIITYIITATY